MNDMKSDSILASESKELTIAIVSYNSYDAITKCLDDLITSGQFPVIIIDNASTDGSSDKLATRYPNAMVISSDVNLGYGRGANLAIKSCSTQYLFLVNPDLKATPEKTAQLFETFKTLPDDVALLAPSADPKTHTNEGPVEKDWVIGAAMMFNLKAMKPIGFFDENIFLFFEETDLCIRIRKARNKIFLDSNLYIEHLYRQSSTPSPSTEALKDWHYAWSKMHLHNKHRSNLGKLNPHKVALNYLLKYLFARHPIKKQRYKYRYLGSKAFIHGTSAFRSTGQPHTPN